MYDIAKEIVIAMLENNYIEKSTDSSKNIENVNKALDSICKQLEKTKQDIRTGK